MDKNRVRTLLLSAAILALGMVLLGWMLRNGILRFKESERVVTVKGLSEQEVKADRVIWPLTYKVIGNDLPELYNSIEKTNATIIAFLKKNGIDEKEITVSPSQLVDLKADRYGSYNPSTYHYGIDRSHRQCRFGSQSDATTRRSAQTRGRHWRRRLPIPDRISLYRAQRHQAQNDRRGDGQCPDYGREICTRFEKQTGKDSYRLSRAVLHQ